MINRFSTFVEENEDILLAAYGGASAALAFAATLLAQVGGL